MFDLSDCLATSSYCASFDWLENGIFIFLHWLWHPSSCYFLVNIDFMWNSIIVAINTRIQFIFFQLFMVLSIFPSGGLHLKNVNRWVRLARKTTFQCLSSFCWIWPQVSASHPWRSIYHTRKSFHSSKIIMTEDSLENNINWFVGLVVLRQEFQWQLTTCLLAFIATKDLLPSRTGLTDAGRHFALFYQWTLHTTSWLIEFSLRFIVIRDRKSYIEFHFSKITDRNILKNSPTKHSKGEEAATVLTKPISMISHGLNAKNSMAFWAIPFT